MSRSRTNAITGESVTLFAFFYKDNELTEPSSIGPVKIMNSQSSILASFPASNVTSMGNGIKKLIFDVPNTYEKDHYTDRWTNIVFESGYDSSVYEFEFTVNEAEWEVSDAFFTPAYNLVVDSDYYKFKLNEKKWIKFNIKDTNNYLSNTDEVSLLLKDYNGSNVYLSSITVNERLNAFYYFNSSQVKADYPSYIDRDSTYEWVLKIKYKNEEFLPDPVQFKFSET